MKKFLEINNYTFLTKVASTSFEKKYGLMFNINPEILAFEYSEPKINKIWMKNTFVPLAIVFASQNRVVDICQGQPLDLAVIGPDCATDLIVEFPLEMFKTLSLSVNDYIKLS